MDKKRFSILSYTGFALITALIGFNWFMWGPLLKSIVEPKYHVSGFLLALFISSVPIMLVFLSYSVGDMADRDPKKTTIIASSILLFSVLLRPLTTFNFYVLLTDQIVLSISAAFCFPSWAPLTYRLFKKEKAASLIAGFTAALTGGQIVAFLITYPIVRKIGLTNTMWVYGITTAIISVFFIVIIKSGDFPYSVATSKRPSLSEGIKIVLSEKSMIPLMVISFLDIGVFAWLAGWYTSILVSHKGISPTQAGIVNSFILIGCLIGAETVPNISHHIKKVKIFLLLLPIICISMLSIVPMLHSFLAFLIDGLVLGFALFPMYPLGVHLPSAYSKIGIAFAGVGSGVMLIAGNLGGFILPELGATVQEIHSAIILFGIIPMVLMFISALFFKDPDTYQTA
jgi:predicted MFS family arabinose efflux permease